MLSAANAFRVLLITALISATSSAALASAKLVIRGQVRDVSGASIDGATVRLGDSVQQTNRDGRFAISLDAERIGGDGTLRLEVSAPGFLAMDVAVTSGTEINITLPVSRVESRLSVSANGKSASDVTTINSDELMRTPVFAVDELLRRVPGFSLFRRTPSWSANPTTQGVSLRGVGASGASRGLVLLDGVPLNDPFGGWVYWGRVSPVTLRSAEIAEGSASELYGTDAVGGVVNLSRESRESATAAQFESSAGNLVTGNGGLNAGITRGKWSADVAASGFRTDGYVPVSRSVRGLIHVPANSRQGEAWLEVGRSLGTAENGGRVFVSGELYGEDRQNGTRLQTNGATVRMLTAGAEHTNSAIGTVSVRAWGGTEILRQTFSAFSADRNTENLTRNQGVPAAQAGLTAVWSRTIRGRHNVVAGAEARWVEGESAEWAFAQQQITQQIRNGGSQRREAVFGEDRVRLANDFLLTAALRVDHWSNYDGFSSTHVLSTGVTTSNNIADRSETAVSPKLGISWAVAQRLSLYASAGRAFRAPTLNELYRSFRVGSILTQANPDLRAERATSVEGGAVLSVSPSVEVKTGYWWLDMTRPVANVTITSTASLITRERQNLGRLNSQGVFASGDWKVSERAQLRIAYQFARAIVTDSPQDPTLVGNWIPQVARYNASAQLLLRPTKKTTVSLDARWHGLQYDDDLNHFPLAGYPWLGGQVSQDVSPQLEVFASAENILNRRYEVGKTPTVTIGPPVVATVGLRWRVGKR